MCVYKELIIAGGTEKDFEKEPPDEYMFSSNDMITFMSDDMVIGVLLDNSVGLVCELVSRSLP